jgi:hypothetical protein
MNYSCQEEADFYEGHPPEEEPEPTPPMTTIEKDEELEKFISERMKKFKDEMAGLYILDAMREVAAFSAKRAREKAIEECKIIVNQNFKPHQAEGDWGNAGDTAENIQKQLAELKS